MTTDESAWSPTSAAIEALLELLPAMERPGRGGWQSPPQAEDGAVVMPYFVSDDVESRFVACAYEDGWMHGFDWPAWQHEAARFSNDVSLVAAASIDTLRKLITTHVRKERFCEGHLRAARNAGVLTAILRRLQDFA